jgi:predicted ATPase/class 3 adenylate cyclase
MLFSDAEGSTALLSRLGDRYGEALSAQRAIQRAAFTEFGGHEMGTEGDSFFVVFRSAADAVRGCVAAQQGLASHRWPEGIALRVRMGLHSGEPARHEDGYIGLDVHRAARIAAAAHGGQVVASEATRLLAAPRLPSGVSFHDLGFHRLKDIEAPEHIYQLAAAGLAERFPPLRSLGAATSFPAPMTPLVGRDDELVALRATIARPEVRLVTLTGPGGVGKTRLALAAAASLHEAFPHGGYFAPAGAGPRRRCDVEDDRWQLGRDRRRVRRGRGQELPARTRGAAGPGQLGAAGRRRLGGGRAPGGRARLVILATSRRPLHVQGEHEQPVPPLAISGGGTAAEVEACGAARLFVQQAQMVRPGFTITDGNAADIVAICARLDGLPLAIELAASRIRLLTPQALRGRLGQGLALGAADMGRPQRQQTVRDTIAWSHELLSPALAAVFRRLSVFAGGCDLDALAAVAADGADPLELAAELQDLSLITVTEGADGEPRVGMLETIQDYALERLAEAGELEETRRRHATYYACFAEDAAEQLHGPAQLAALDRLEAEHDNLRAALAWSLDAAAEGAERDSIGLRLASALTKFWYQHGHIIEGRRWLERAIELTADEVGAPLARLAHGLGILLIQLGELDEAVRLFERSLAIWRELGDRDQQARELNTLGITRYHRGELDAARSVLRESITIARTIGSDPRLATALTNLGQVEATMGNYGQATQLLHEALVLDQKQGDLQGQAVGQQSLAEISLRTGQIRQARALLRDMLGYATGSGDTEFLAYTLELAACIAAGLRDCLQAARLAGAADGLRQKLGIPRPAKDEALLKEFLVPAQAATPAGAWDAELAAGRALTQPQAAGLLRSAARGGLPLVRAARPSACAMARAGA